MKVEDIARVAHEANRALTQIVQDVPVQQPWSQAGADMQESTIKGVYAAIRLIDEGALLEDRGRLMHESWCEDRRAHGWTYGESKDTEKKTHPALRPYAELPEGTRRKDVVFFAIVAALR